MENNVENQQGSQSIRGLRLKKRGNCRERNPLCATSILIHLNRQETQKPKTKWQLRNYKAKSFSQSQNNGKTKPSVLGLSREIIGNTRGFPLGALKSVQTRNEHKPPQRQALTVTENEPIISMVYWSKMITPSSMNSQWR